VATLTANVTHGLGHGPFGAAAAAWPAAALVGGYELLMSLIRSSRTADYEPDAVHVSDDVPTADPLQAQAADTFAEQIAGVTVPAWVDGDGMLRASPSRIPSTPPGRYGFGAFGPVSQSARKEDGARFGSIPRMR